MIQIRFLSHNEVQDDVTSSTLGNHQGPRLLLFWWLVIPRVLPLFAWFKGKTHMLHILSAQILLARV